MFSTPNAYTQNLKDQIFKALDQGAHPIAAFDADGTCWFSDVGRDFFEHQIECGFFPEGQKHTLADYQAQEDIDIKQGLVWLAQILKGFSLQQVREFGQQFQKAKPPAYIEHQKEIIQFLHEQNVEVYIVTASVKWTIEAAASELGIAPSHVIGIETQVENDIITDKVIEPITWAEGKAQCLLKATKGRAPFFCSGNTWSDVPMIKKATHIKQVLHSASPDSDIYNNECKALNEAKSQGWFYMNFKTGESH